MTEDLSGLDTFPKLLLHHARTRGEGPAIREKDLGIWQTWTWKQLADEVRSLACGLAAHGFKRGDHLALVGDNRPRFYAMMCAAQCLGGIPVPLYQDAAAAEMAFPIQNAEISQALAEDQEQVDKLLEILPKCPTLKHIYYDDARGMRHYTAPQLMAYDRLRDLGFEKRRVSPKGLEPDLEQLVAARQLRLRIVAQAARLVVVDARQARALRQDLEQLVDLLLVFRQRVRDRRILDREGHLGRHRVLVERHRDPAKALRRAHRGVDARAVVADDREMVAALEILRRQSAGERAHFIGEAMPAPGLPDAEVLLADRRMHRTRARVVHQQLRKRVARVEAGMVLRHDFPPLGLRRIL